MDAKHFFPEREQPGALNANEAGYEGLKASFNASLDTIEQCNTRCSNAEIGTEPCLKKCFQKFFNSSLLIRKEWEQYTKIGK